MAQAPPELPTRFPCWCRAVFSWGGETKRDLPIIEGDLIECLNAGDGSWWMGRLKRDRRMIGLFPSNFVRLVEDDICIEGRGPSPIPPLNGRDESVSRSASPMPRDSFSAEASPKPQKSPSKAFRRPFASYVQTGSRLAKAKEMDSVSMASSPAPLARSRQPSPVSTLDYRPDYDSRGPSPAPSFVTRQPSFDTTPDHLQDLGSSPPPPAPPPHRVAYTPQTPTSKGHGSHMGTQRSARPASAAPPSPRAMDLTPSPLRDAMDDVMSSLHDMGIHENPSSPSRSKTSAEPWSPEAFDYLNQNNSSRHNLRPCTSLGIGGRGDHDVDEYNEDEYENGPANMEDPEDPPQVTGYVQRMEKRLREMQKPSVHPQDELFLPTGGSGPDRKEPVRQSLENNHRDARPTSAFDRWRPGGGSTDTARKLRHRKSAYEVGRDMIGRTFTIKSTSTSASSGVQSTSTNGSNSTQLTSQSLMSGHSAGGFSATSAGSLARRRGAISAAIARPMSVIGMNREDAFSSNGRRSALGGGTVSTLAKEGAQLLSHHSRSATSSQADWADGSACSAGILGGLTAPKPKRSGFFKKMIDTAKTGAASARSTIAAGQPMSSQSGLRSILPDSISSISGGIAAKEMGLGSGDSAIDWVQVRRDVNRSNSLSRNERVERQERCQMMDHPVISPVDALDEIVDGDEGADGLPVQQPTNFQAINLNLVDKNARFINSLPPMSTPQSLAQTYVCRPYRSDAQRLRAIFTWVSEKILWEEDFDGAVDCQRVLQMKRGSAEEVAVLFMEMCSAVGLHAEVVRGYLKAPGEELELDINPRPNHWWNAVIVDGEWRIMDCSLASPSNPRRALYSIANSQLAESWWFLARPSEICYTHVPSLLQQQHICPPVHQEILMALPCACPPYFKNGLQMLDYDTSLLIIEDLELVQVQVTVPADVECVAEVEARAYQTDGDGDFFENGEVVRKAALAQAEWVGGQKRYTIKALLPGDEGHGSLKVYAGKRGLMHSIKDNPHPLAFALPISHTGKNPPYEFLTRHPTPHAQRHDLYVAQPQCSRLAINNTFVFAVRQHPYSLAGASTNPGSASPGPPVRPSSAMSMTSSSASGSASGSAFSQKKPAKLAVQAPSGKILRLMRKSEHTISTGGPGGGEAGDGGVWETIIKCSERGIWRGLVLADRSARWCVFAEWNCV